MTEPKITLNPSEQIVQQAAKEVTVHDQRGRSILLRKPGVLSQYRLIELVGPETAKNEVYMTMVLPVTFVQAIDGEPVVFPTTKRELEAVIQRLDEDGISTVINAVRTQFGAPDPSADAAALKN